MVKYAPSLKAPKGKYGTSFFTIHGNRVTACYASIERLEIYGEAEYVVSQSVYRHFAYPILYFAKGIPVPRLRYSLGYAFFMSRGTEKHEREEEKPETLPNRHSPDGERDSIVRYNVLWT